MLTNDAPAAPPTDPAAPNRRLYIETVGCQMNVLDSELVVGALRKRGFEVTGDPDAADTLLFNTCSVREKGRAEDLQRPRPAEVPQAPTARDRDRRAGLHGPEG